MPFDFKQNKAQVIDNNNVVLLEKDKEINLSTLRIGAQILYKFNDTWWEASIIEIKDNNNFKIHYNGCDSKSDFYSCYENNKDKFGYKKQDASKIISIDSNKVQVLNEQEISKLQKNDILPHKDPFGIWYEAKIININGRDFHIHYNGWVAVYDCYVDSSRESSRFGKLISEEKYDSDDKNLPVLVDNLSITDEDPNNIYVELFISCPACKDGNDKPSYWYHSTDMKNMCINQDGIVKCLDGHWHKFKDWRWNCGNHNGKYLEADAEYIAAALQSALLVIQETQLPNKKKLKWFYQLVTKVTEQFEEDE